MKEPFTNREILEKFNDIKESLSRIEDQTKKTNGRVTRIEWWKQLVSGGMAVIVIVVVPLFSWVLYKVSTLDTTVQVAVSTALIPYTK